MKKTILIAVVTVLTFSCKDNKNSDADLTDIDRTKDSENMDGDEGEWTSLFDGSNLDNWKAYNSDSTIAHWKIEDNAVVLTPSEGENSGSENLITKDEYTDFVLSLDWKISEAGNSGIMWGVHEDAKLNEPYLSGPEIQILDNEKHPDGKNGPNRHAGALYDMQAPSESATNPVGEWNHFELTIDHVKNMGMVELNGKKVNEFPLSGEEWDQMIQKSKFKDWQDFAKYKTGHIALQDHGNQVSFKNIKIKELN